MRSSCPQKFCFVSPNKSHLLVGLMLLYLTKKKVLPNLIVCHIFHVHPIVFFSFYLGQSDVYYMDTKTKLTEKANNWRFEHARKPYK